MKRLLIKGAAISAAVLLSVAVRAEKAPQWEGFYSAPSNLCTSIDAKRGRLASCAAKSRDCVRIKRTHENEYAVQAYSTQAQQHTCAINGTGRLVGNQLVVQIDEEKPNQFLKIERSRTGIKLMHEVGKDEVPANCGAHASLQGLVLKRVNVNPEVAVCFDD